jgi:hypothetical protein
MIDLKKSALLVIDLQNDFVRKGAPMEVEDARTTLPKVQVLLQGEEHPGRLHQVPIRSQRDLAVDLEPADQEIWRLPTGVKAVLRRHQG